MKKFILFVFPLILFSCKKDPVLSNETTTSPEPLTGEVTVRVTNVSDNNVLVISEDVPYTPTTTVYLNAKGDTFAVTKLKYYISNVRLKKADGTFYVEPDSYHLIDAADSINKCSFTLKKVPADNYIAMEFILGVDSIKTMSGVQNGDLDPIHDMYWDWNQGYIFFKFEGYSNKAPANISHNITFHVGGFQGMDKVIVSYNLPFPLALSIDKDHHSSIFMKTNIQECFRNPDSLSFADYNFSTTGSSSKILVANYGDMFTVSAVKH